MSIIRAIIEDAGDYFIKIVKRLPPRGNYGVLYIEKLEEEDTFSEFNLFQADGTYKKIRIVEKLLQYTVDNLPEGNIGDRAYVTDATSPQYLQTLTGGGTVTCPAFFNGINWISA